MGFSLSPPGLPHALLLWTSTKCWDVRGRDVDDSSARISVDCFVDIAEFQFYCCGPSALNNTVVIRNCCSHLLTECPNDGKIQNPREVAVVADATPKEEALDSVVTAGNPLCFKWDAAGFTYEHCCNKDYGPMGDASCWDTWMDYAFCCRDPLPLPAKDHSCWAGALKDWHEVCCIGTTDTYLTGPRGNSACWQNAALNGEGDLDAERCCDFVAGHGGARCLVKGRATTCSFGDVAFRHPTLLDVLRTQGEPVPEDDHRDPILWSKRHGLNIASVAHFLTFGIGAYAAAATRLERQAKELQMFDRIFSYKNFSFASTEQKRMFSRHLDAWNLRSARIAGFGWWKPVLCRKHFESSELPINRGIAIFSDAGSYIEAISKSSWYELIRAMQHYDIMAVVDTNFPERYFTKQHTINKFARSLEGTYAANEGQFLSGLIAMRKTRAAMKLLSVWEALIADISLVDEEVSKMEHADFREHRHEQSVWSLLLKCAILGRSAPDGRGGLVNVSAKVLVVNKEFEAYQFIDFRRTPRNAADAVKEYLMLHS